MNLLKDLGSVEKICTYLHPTSLIVSHCVAKLTEFLGRSILIELTLDYTISSDGYINL